MHAIAIESFNAILRELEWRGHQNIGGHHNHKTDMSEKQKRRN